MFAIEELDKIKADNKVIIVLTHGKEEDSLAAEEEVKNMLYARSIKSIVITDTKNTNYWKEIGIQKENVLENKMKNEL